MYSISHDENKQANKQTKPKNTRSRVNVPHHKTSRTVCNESCLKSQQLQFAEIRKMVSVDPAWNILTCASQNMDEEMSKLLAVKIIQTYTQLMKMQSETESQSSSSLSITIRRFISFWTIRC